MYLCFNFCAALTLLVYCSKCSPLSNHPPIDDNPKTREKYALFHCYKHRQCTPGGNPVCGFDSTQAFLAEFEDMCTFHKVNCEKKGYFTLVEAYICEGQKKFLNEPRDYDVFDRNLTSVQKLFYSTRVK